jgi:signal transduction histidine kinase
MVKRLKSVPRLTLIFISTLIVSGSILTYFSINNISNFKELTIKKISEEQELIVDEVIIAFEKRIEDIAKGYSGPALVWGKNTAGGVLNSFAIGKFGVFLKPWYSDRLSIKPIRASSASYIEAYRLGEISEYQERNPAKAQRYYRRCLEQSADSRDSAKSCNALARVYDKLGKYDLALEKYSDIINKHYSTLNESGFPFCYYAFNQIVGLDRLPEDSIMIKDFSFFISKMVSGQILLNQSSGEIINQIDTWVRQSDISSENRKTNILKDIETIKGYLKFISDYYDVITAGLAAGGNPDLPILMEDFTAFRGIEPDNSDLVLMNMQPDTVFGFVLKLDALWEYAIDGISLPEPEFENNIDLIKSDDGHVMGEGDLTAISGISVFFPSHQIKVNLKNQNIVNEYVAQRSWVYGIALVLLLGGMILGIVLILRDIKRESRLASLRSDFVSNVTHELKTPLTSINMFAESIYLGGGLSEEEQKQYSNVIIKESGNLRRMINNILSFSIKEGGKQNYQFKKTDLSLTVKSILEEMNYWLEKHRFIIEAKIEDGIWINADQEAIKQAISNLINNAIKYSPTEKKLRVRLYGADGDAVLEIEDSGIGIPEDKLQKIFEKFYRVRSQDMESTSGTGIGLTVTRDIVEAHGGRIEVSSIIDRGSTFKIILNINIS